MRIPLANCFNSGKGNVDEEGKTRQVHAGVQTGSGAACGIRESIAEAARSLVLLIRIHVMEIKTAQLAT
jgi:hypothetical protein